MMVNTGGCTIFSSSKADERFRVVKSDQSVRERLLWWAYNGMLTLAWPWLVLDNLLRCATNRRRWATAWQRLGWQTPLLTSESPRIWVHALSVGETHSVAPLLQALRESLPQWGIVFSTATETGQEAARRVLSQWVDDFCYMPHDFSWSVTAMIRRVRPHMVVLVETDVWPNLVWTCHPKGIPCVLVNARVSNRSFVRLKALRAFVEPVWNRFAMIFAQSKLDHERFLVLGIMPERLIDVGNLKFDSRPKPLPTTDRERLRRDLGLSADRPVWIAGSTHEGEEILLLETHRRLLQTHRNCLLIVAPRQIQRAAVLVRICDRLGLTVACRSLGEKAADRQVFLLDTLGELASFYALAKVGFIGGSLTPVGGHNPLEALAQGVPMVWGPHLSNFRQIEEFLLASGCARRVDDGQQLLEVVRRWLDDAGLQARVAEAAGVLFDQHAGSVRRILTRLLELLPESAG
ncbi:MAG TPA: hypothetical protein DCZ69_01770 [Syntrophobacteraceae bacterium]|nr:hypothetical protein [Syntrophobacteraceae bacterium]